jgi:hypothetical protein
VPGLVPIGARRPPEHCPTCGASFPWTDRRPAAVAARDTVDALEQLLRRLPQTIRQLRTRHGNRPPFRVEDAYDLEDLIRAVLPVQFNDVRCESRTPRYDSGTRTDFLLKQDQIAITLKWATTRVRDAELAQQLQEDVAYYAHQRTWRALVVLIYNPEGFPMDLRSIQAAVAGAEMEVKCIVAG